MNNYHLFLIRSNCVTQLAAHLLAGILALVLFAGLSAPKDPVRPDAIRPARVSQVTLPAATVVLASSNPGLR